MNRLWQRDMPKSSLEALVVLVALVILFILFVLIPALGLFRPRAPEADTRSQLKVLASILEFDWAPRQASLPVSDEVNAGARLLCEVLDETVVSDDPLDGGGWRGSMEMDPWDHPILVDLWRRPVIFIDSCNYDGTFTYSVDGEMIQVRAAGNISDLPDPGGVLWSLGKNGTNEYGSGDDLLVRWPPPERRSKVGLPALQESQAVESYQP